MSSLRSLVGNIATFTASAIISSSIFSKGVVGINALLPVTVACSNACICLYLGDVELTPTPTKEDA